MKKSQSMELLQFLKNVPLLKDISEQYLKIMLDFLHLRTCKSGEVIIFEGEKGESMFFLFQGKVSITKRLTLFGEINGKGELDKTIIKLKDSDFAFFGEMSLCAAYQNREVRSATVSAEMNCLLGEISADKINELVQEHLDFGMIFYRNLSNILADRLRKANRDILKLTTALTLALEERS